MYLHIVQLECLLLQVQISLILFTYYLPVSVQHKGFTLQNALNEFMNTLG